MRFALFYLDEQNVYISRFKQENLEKLDINQRAQFAGQAASSWLNFHLQMVGVVMVGGIAFIAVVQHHLENVSPGQIMLNS
jgi:ATP-binding cassette subfamily C (CFTR/MRP) protein 10